MNPVSSTDCHRVRTVKISFRDPNHLPIPQLSPLSVILFLLTSKVVHLQTGIMHALNQASRRTPRNLRFLLPCSRSWPLWFVIVFIGDNSVALLICDRYICPLMTTPMESSGRRTSTLIYTKIYTTSISGFCRIFEKKAPQSTIV